MYIILGRFTESKTYHQDRYDNEQKRAHIEYILLKDRKWTLIILNLASQENDR